MTNNLVSIKKLHRHWSGKVIPFAYQALEAGIRLELDRLATSRFVVIEHIRDVDEDGGGVLMRILDGFTDLDAAQAFADECLTKAWAEVYARSNEYYRWELDTSCNDKPWYPCGKSNHLESRYLRSFRALNRSGYDYAYRQYNVVEVLQPPITLDSLVEYTHKQDKLTSWLTLVGEGRREYGF